MQQTTALWNLSFILKTILRVLIANHRNISLQKPGHVSERVFIGQKECLRLPLPCQELFSLFSRDSCNLRVHLSVKDVANSRVYCRWTFLTASPDASVKFDWGEDLMLQIATFRRTCPSTRRHSHHSSQGYGLEEEIVIPVLDNLSTATPFKFQI